MRTDTHRGYGAYLIEAGGRRIVFGGDTAFTRGVPSGAGGGSIWLFFRSECMIRGSLFTVIWRRRGGWRWIATLASCCRCIIGRFGWFERGYFEPIERLEEAAERDGGGRIAVWRVEGKWSGWKDGNGHCARLEATRSRTLRCFDLSEEQFDRNYGPGKWTVRFLLHHLADAETVLFDRIRRGDQRTQAGAVGVRIRMRGRRAWTTQRRCWIGLGEYTIPFGPASSIKLVCTTSKVATLSSFTTKRRSNAEGGIRQGGCT